MNPYTMIKDARWDYLQHINGGGYEVVVTATPHQSSGLVAVYDSDLGLCPKAAALKRHGIEPTHPALLAENSLSQLHRMRNGIVVEKEWVATLRHFHPDRWLVRDGVRLNEPTRGKVDVWLDLSDALEPLAGATSPFTSVLVEVKRTDGNL